VGATPTSPVVPRHTVLTLTGLPRTPALAGLLLAVIDSWDGTVPSRFKVSYGPDYFMSAWITTEIFATYHYYAAAQYPLPENVTLLDWPRIWALIYGMIRPTTWLDPVFQNIPTRPTLDRGMVCQRRRLAGDI